jgi:hypothetical protein
VAATSELSGQEGTVTVVAVTISTHGEFVVSADAGEDVDAHTDRVMEALLALEDDNLTDSAVGVDLGTGLVEVEVTARGETFEDAVATADAAIRTAIHAAGGSTPNWRVTQVAQHAELLPA